MVSKVVRANIVNLQRLAKSTPKRARTILNNANGELLEAIRQCVLNVLNGVVEITPKLHKQLKRHRYILRKLKNVSTKKTEKKKIIQTGSGFIVPLLAAVLPHIIGGIAGLIARRKNTEH